MDFEQLRQLEAIDRAGSISAAAEELLLTQPTLSRSLQRLERDLGQQLFTRTRNSVTLNDAGRIVVEHARQILADERRLRDALDELSRRQRTLRVGSVAPAPVWRLTGMATTQFPGTLLDTDMMQTGALAQALLNGEVDLAITLTPPQLPGVTSIPLMTEDLFLSAPLTSPLAGRASVSMADLDGEPFLVLEAIGFWMDVCRKCIPNSQLIVQKDATVFQQLILSTDLCTFTSNADQNLADPPGRRRVPITDGSAHATFFLCTSAQAPERAREIFAWVRDASS